jgi:2,3-bisphosphoglycerate-independent phosphoglycerate mutase
MTPRPFRPVILCILDGWGIAPVSSANGISLARTPNWNRFLQTLPHTQLQASELFVGLPRGQMGNSEVGHMTIGAGKVIMQDLPRIDSSLLTGELETRPDLIRFIQKLHHSGGACHLMGLLSPGGVHSHQSHFEAMANILTKEGIPLHIHAFLDGRDTPPQSAAGYVKNFTKNTHIPLSTISGRYFAMDRDNRWDRVEKAYKAIVEGHAPAAHNFTNLMENYYQQGVGDEFIPPHCTFDYKGMKPGDGLFMVNFRADRVRQLLSAFLFKNFTAFNRRKPPFFAATLGMTDYSRELAPLISALFVKEPIQKCLGSIVSDAGLKQMRLAETEKYAHVTFFFNGGRETIFPGEERILVPSPAVATYDLCPEMAATELTEKLAKAVKTQQYDLIVVNYANADMVGHTGVQPAIIKAVETLDGCLGQIEDVAGETGYTVIITADHGNAEQMIEPASEGVHTAHTCNPVPFVLLNGPSSPVLEQNGKLSDIAPTILALLGISVPVEMTGQSLIKSKIYND